MNYLLFTIQKNQGFTLQPTIHFCKDCGYIGLALFNYEAKFIFYAG
jgi:hypothetical protein